MTESTRTLANPVAKNFKKSNASEHFLIFDLVLAMLVL